MITRSKIVATYGPACAPEKVFVGMLRAGLDVVRLNISHLDPSDLEETVATLRKRADRAKLPLTVLADMPGPKVRCTRCEPESFELDDGQSIEVAPGKNKASTPERIYIPYEHLLEDVKVGHELAVNDGIVLLKVRKVDRDAGVLRCRVEHGGTVASRKGVSFLQTTLRIPNLTARDRKGLRAAAAAQVDYVALSFVRSADEVQRARRILKRAGGGDIQIIAKIEQHEAVDHIDEILDAADGVMVARGDMGIERPLEQVPHIQKDIIHKANLCGKPVITATQMLESMTEHSRPTRAEVTDVANAILDGTDAVMLSAETAMGKHPARVVRTMDRIAVVTDARIDGDHYLAEMDALDNGENREDLDDALARAVCRLMLDAHLDAIVCLTFHGSTARRVARYRPAAPIHAVSPYDHVCRQLALVWGVEAEHMPKVGPGRGGKTKLPGQLIGPILQALAAKKRLRKSDRIAFLAGIPLDAPGGTNYLRVIEVADWL